MKENPDRKKKKKKFVSVLAIHPVAMNLKLLIGNCFT